MEMLRDAYSNRPITGASGMKTEEGGRERASERESGVAHANLEADYFASGTVMR